MAKVKQKTQVFKCKCSVCKQVAFTESGKTHFYCNGLILTGPLPAEFKGLHNPNRKGVWTKVEEVATVA